jgi:site-specific recombinase XerC
VRIGNVVYGADRLIAEWVGQRIPGYVQTPGVAALGVIKGNKVVAGVTYERCNGVNIEASIAAEPGSGWADRHTLFHIFAYPFLQLGVEAVTVLVPMDNLSSLNLATKLGFNHVALIPFAAHGGGPLVVLQMYREQCRWLRHGQGQHGTGTA